MLKRHIAPLGALAASLWLCGSIGPLAAEAEPPSQQRPVLHEFISRTLYEHPALQAAKANLNAAKARARGQSRPLYNPELEVGYEDGADKTKSVGISQTIDWSGKRGARSSVALAEVDAAGATLQITRKALFTELLTALADYQTRREGFSLAEHRVQLAKDFLALAERRNMAGDLPKTELLTARLTLAGARAELNAARSELSSAEERLIAVAGEEKPLWPMLAGEPTGLPQSGDDVQLQALPELRLSLAETQISRSRIQVAKRNRVPDPTLGLTGGEENSGTLFGVRLSVPLPVRNNYRAEVEAAGSDLIATQQSYNDLQRRLRARLQASNRRYQAVTDAWQDWRDQGAVPLEEQRALLGRLWEAGEISAVDYLVQLNQTFATESAAVALRGRLWTAWFQWLDASGRVDEWMEQIQ